MRIPLERLTVRFSRSGGPGGQNVNKVSSKAELRFALADADWIPAPVRERLREICRGRINAAGELVLSSSVHREQRRNLEECLAKLGRWIDEASRVPKRRRATRPTAGARRRRREGKTRRARIKRERSRGGSEE